MAENELGIGEYLHAFTLYQAPKKGKDTSAEARAAYTDALKAKGFKRYALGEEGRRVRLPEATMVGTFAGEAAAIAAVKDAEVLAKTAHPGQFFRESAVLTPYHRLRLIGPRLTLAADTPKPAPAAKPTRADGLIAKINANKNPKRT